MQNVHGSMRNARKALRHLQACQPGIPDLSLDAEDMDLVKSVSKRARIQTAEYRAR